MFFTFGYAPLLSEQMQTEAKQKALQDLQDCTRNLEAVDNGLRSFKHDYVNILLCLSGYIEDGDMGRLKDFFESKIFPTKNLITGGDYKLNQLGNIGVLEIKSLLSAKMIYAHESGIDITIDIPDKAENFLIDTVDLARILGIFLDNAMEAALETQQPYMSFQYRVEAMDFVLKDNPAEVKVKLRECLLNAMERYTLQTNKTHKVYTLEVSGRKISVDYEFPGTLKELASILDSNFVRCHRTFLVNKK